jgi:hypothetical protein
MPAATIEQDYRDFASMEARGASPAYERLALGVAGDPELVGLLAELPPAKRQPNLLFAAARYAGAPTDGYDEFRRFVLDQRDTVVETMRSRRTQTNEPGRCGALYAVLAALPQPLALLEVGASAGLCLLADRYAYDFDGVRTGAPDSPLTLRVHTEGRPPLSEPGPVSVAWRAGIDLNPLDVTDPDDVRWLRTLIWPGQDDRLRRLDAALAVAEADPPRVVPGDLNERFDDVVAQAPEDATLVVFHTAVLYYLPEPARSAFVERVTGLRGHWISQEIAGLLPAVDAQLPEPPPGDTLTYTLALDHRPLAFTAIHGGWLRWLS